MEKVEKKPKQLVLESSENHPSLYVVVWKGGPGKVPNVLAGEWTKRTGLEAIENYINK